MKKKNKQIFIWCIVDDKLNNLWKLWEIDYICTGYPEKFI